MTTVGADLLSAVLGNAVDHDSTAAPKQVALEKAETAWRRAVHLARTARAQNARLVLRITDRAVEDLPWELLTAGHGEFVAGIQPPRGDRGIDMLIRASGSIRIFQCKDYTPPAGGLDTWSLVRNSMLQHWLIAEWSDRWLWRMRRLLMRGLPPVQATMEINAHLESTEAQRPFGAASGFGPRITAILRELLKLLRSVVNAFRHELTVVFIRTSQVLHMAHSQANPSREMITAGPRMVRGPSAAGRPRPIGLRDGAHRLALPLSPGVRLEYRDPVLI